MRIFYGDIIGKGIHVFPIPLGRIVFPVSFREWVKGRWGNKRSVQICAANTVGVYIDGQDSVCGIQKEGWKMVGVFGDRPRPVGHH